MDDRTFFCRELLSGLFAVTLAQGFAQRFQVFAVGKLDELGKMLFLRKVAQFAGTMDVDGLDHGFCAKARVGFARRILDGVQELESRSRDHR